MFGDLDILSFVRISLLNWIGYVNGMDSDTYVKYLIIIIVIIIITHREVD
jgi:hypothetical protein